MKTIRAITLTQPSAYLAGVVLGDGWCSTRELGLRVADRDFAEAFASAIRAIDPSVAARVRLYRGYWDVRTSNKTGRWNWLRDVAPDSSDARCAWLLGLFDSEGNASLRDLPSVSPQAKGRRIALFSTNEVTLERAAEYLDHLGIPTRLFPWTMSKGHLGKRPVFALEVRGGRISYGSFAKLIGSNIARKQSVLDALPLSYQPPGHHARMQERGVATRKARQATGGRY